MGERSPTISRGEGYIVIIVIIVTIVIIVFIVSRLLLRAFSAAAAALLIFSIASRVRCCLATGVRRERWFCSTAAWFRRSERWSRSPEP